MRFIITLITSLILLIPASGQGQWKIVNEGFEPKSVDFISNDKGWIVDEVKGLFKTTNGGKNWRLVNDEKVYSEIDFYNESIGWALRSYAGRTIIEKTLDGGQTWFQKWSGSYSFQDILAFSEDIIYVIGPGKILKTADGGGGWLDITPSLTYDYNSASFINADTGIVFRSARTILRTFNGGETWNSIDIADFAMISEPRIINNSTGYFFAKKTYGSENQYICKTTDLFSTWTVLSQTDLPISSCHFFENGIIIASMKFDDGHKIMKSTNGGASWKDTENMGFDALGDDWGVNHDELYFDENVGYLFAHVKSSWGVSNERSLILKSTDQGDLWTCMNLSFPFPLNDIHFVNRDRGFIVGGETDIHINWGRLLMTQDEGKTWEIAFNPYHYDNIHFVNESIGFMMESDEGQVYRGSILTSSDGGYNWVEDTSMRGVKDILFINDSTGWAAGSQAIYKTINGGENWSEEYEPVSKVNSLFFIDDSKGWAVGEGGLITKYSLNNGWEKFTGLTSLPLNEVFFIDRNNGWISGGYSSSGNLGSIFMRTVDGGENWDKITDMNYLINDFYFEDKDNGWAVGEDNEEGGVILETFNGGLDWDVVVNTENRAIGALNALHFKDGVGWAVGDDGLMLTTNYASSSTVNRFMVVGDPHNYSPSSDFSQTMLYEIALAAIEEEVDFIFFTGDLVVRGFDSPANEDSVLKDWRFVLSTLDQHNIKVYACRGNNDVSSRQAWDSLFSGTWSFPQNGPELEKNITYAVEYDNLMFVALDQYTDYQKINQVWLDDLLATTTSEHIFVAGHAPAFKVSNSCMSTFPENRNLLWESLTDAGVKAYFSGHDHFYDHTIINDGDGNTDNDIHQVITGTGGGSLHGDGEYNGDNGRWTPYRIFHEQEKGYVLVEVNGAEVEMRWKKRIGPNIFEDGGDSFIFPSGTSNLQEIHPGNENLVNYPNPFHSNTIITYQLPASSDVELSVYDISGRKVSTLVNESQQADSYEVNWNAEGMEPGIYIGELRTGQVRQVMKMIITK